MIKSYLAFSSQKEVVHSRGDSLVEPQEETNEEKSDGDQSKSES